MRDFNQMCSKDFRVRTIGAGRDVVSGMCPRRHRLCMGVCTGQDVGSGEGTGEDSPGHYLDGKD